MDKISEFTKSAIIGYWRQGNKIETIMWIVGIDYWKVEAIINDYTKLNP